MPIKTIDKFRDLQGKKVLLRADFDVPLKNGKITDTFRIVKQISTIEYLQKQGAKIIIIAHLGRPEPGENTPKLSLKPIVSYLSNTLNKKIKLITAGPGLKAGAVISAMQAGDIVVLENIRFSVGEKKNSAKFAKELAAYGEIFVNNAFAVSHRQHASVAGIQKYLPGYGGLLLAEEISHLNRILTPEKPLITIVGGAKLKSKVKLISKFIVKADHILIGGVLANNFLAAYGLNVGRSLVDKDSIELAKKLIKQSARRGKDNIILPVDVVASSRGQSWQPRATSVKSVAKNEYIFDIGPKTISLYAKLIKQATTIVWNGPMGMFEEAPFRYGTLGVARLVAARSRGHAFGVAGGGETVEALGLTKMFQDLDWVSTGGGAMLSYLAQEKMPGLTKLSGR